MISSVVSILNWRKVESLTSAGRRVWLRPGKKYLFGRVLQDGGMIASMLMTWTHANG